MLQLPIQHPCWSNTKMEIEIVMKNIMDNETENEIEKEIENWKWIENKIEKKGK